MALTIWAGSPGTIEGGEVPASLDALRSIMDGPHANLPNIGPYTDWPYGAYVELGDGSHAYWYSRDWHEGEAPSDNPDETPDIPPPAPEEA